MHAHVIPTGAIIQKLMVPDTSGDMVDVVLGYDILEPYLVRKLHTTTSLYVLLLNSSEHATRELAKLKPYWLPSKTLPKHVKILS